MISKTINILLCICCHLECYKATTMIPFPMLSRTPLAIKRFKGKLKAFEGMFELFWNQTPKMHQKPVVLNFILSDVIWRFWNEKGCQEILFYQYQLWLSKQKHQFYRSYCKLHPPLNLNRKFTIFNLVLKLFELKTNDIINF